MKRTILIVEDERDLAQIVEFNLKNEGFDVIVVYNGEDALKKIKSGETIDMVILDLMLPGISGHEVCKRLKFNDEYKDIPIIMLTAKGEEIDRILGFEFGVDDYLTKPFSVRELILRIQAIMRRSVNKDQKEVKKQNFGLIVLDTSAYKAWVDQKEIKLTALEFKLLKNFIDRSGKVQTREILLSKVWEIDSLLTTRTVDTHVKRLREKLGPAKNYIETVRGVGYRMIEDPEVG